MIYLFSSGSRNDAGYIALCFLLLPSNIIQVSNRLVVIVLLTLAAGIGELFPLW